MDEEQSASNSPVSTQQEAPQTPVNEGVSFTPVPSQSPRKSKTPFLLLLAVLAIGIGAFFIIRGSTREEATATPTPFVVGTTTTEPEPTQEPEEVDKSELSVEIQNGTGITGEAAYLQGILRNMGFEDIKAGNASTQDHVTTTVTFASDLSQTVRDEVVEKLKSIYKEVDAKSSGSQTVDILIVTGLKIGATPKPAATATPTATPTASPTATPTASPSATP